MALGEISLDGRVFLYVLVRGGITTAIHRSDILEPIVRPFAGVICDAFILIQDNARAQRVLVYMTFLDVEGISVMNWLTMSPYLNPIEHNREQSFKTYSTTVVSSRECPEPYGCSGSEIAAHATKGHQDYARSLS